MKQRLLILIPHIGNSGGGVSEAARLLAHSLYKENNFEIHVLTLDTQNDRAAQANWPSVNFYFYSFIGPRNFGFSMGMFFHMLNNKYDVIHVHGIWTFHVFAAGVGLLKHTPIIISPHGMLEPWILNRSPRLKAMVMMLYQAKIFKSTSFFHALTPKETQDISALLPNAKITTIPNFVPQENYSSVSPPEWFDSVLENRKIFLFFGRIHDKKGWRPLLAAWRKLCNTNIDAREHSALVFCGWNDGIADFESKISEAAKEAGNVIFAGAQYGLDRLNSYQAADFFILPSQSEGLPMAVLEAVQNETLVMMSRACNLPTMLDENAALDTGESEESIFGALQKALALNAEETFAIRTKATRHVQLNYSEESVTSAMTEMFHKAINIGGVNSK